MSVALFGVKFQALPFLSLGVVEVFLERGLPSERMQRRGRGHIGTVFSRSFRLISLTLSKLFKTGRDSRVSRDDIGV